jgi:hypothetical protein
MTNNCTGCAEPGKHPHTRDCLFEHFLNFMNMTGCSEHEKALMRTAYGYGMEEGARQNLPAQTWIRRRMAMSEPL